MRGGETEPVTALDRDRTIWVDSEVAPRRSSPSASGIAISTHHRPSVDVPDRDRVERIPYRREMGLLEPARSYRNTRHGSPLHTSGASSAALSEASSATPKQRGYGQDDERPSRYPQRQMLFRARDHDSYVTSSCRTRTCCPTSLHRERRRTPGCCRRGSSSQPDRNSGQTLQHRRGSRRDSWLTSCLSAHGC